MKSNLNLNLNTKKVCFDVMDKLTLHIIIFYFDLVRFIKRKKVIVQIIYFIQVYKSPLQILLDDF